MTLINYVVDCQYIQTLLLENGYETTLAECQEIWETVSEAFDAQWMHIKNTFEDRPTHEILEWIEKYNKKYQFTFNL